MKTYDVYCSWGCVTVKAENVKRVSFDHKPIKILFTVKDKVVAEFYTEHMAGWVEREEEWN